MILSSSIQSTLQRYQYLIDTALRQAIDKASNASSTPALDAYYGQMRYHLGWVDASLAPINSNTGKLLRPILLLLAYEAAGAWGLANTDLADTTHIQRALPVAVAIELIHNFTLIHDDIEDGDTERRHRPTLWKLWGVPQAINTGDGMFALSRQTLWDTLDNGVESALVARLGTIFDRTVQTIAEGQYLDISFETRQDISVAMYADMIRRKTAALMSGAAKMGALLGTRDQETIERLRAFGQAIGIAFQVRDDILGVWASISELGKTAAGDIYRRKKSLPILHALEHASEQDQQVLRTLYQREAAITPEQLGTILTILERTQTRSYCRAFLSEQCQFAYAALANVPHNANPIARRAINDLEVLIHFVEEGAK
ncbi:MAG TPA: polyprenyl synthetase family protein [Ktedonobacteraceae bacterium]|jgi:geranylgeranyl diphosphate synthase type I